MGLNLPTVAEQQAKTFGKPIPKAGLPTPLAKKEREKAKKVSDDAFRAAIWKLDKHRCRATGKTLVKSVTLDWSELGEVDHSIPRSLAPELIYETSNALLLQKQLNRLRKVACLHAPEFRRFSYTGPEDRRKAQHFVWRNEDGKITRETWG